MTDIMIASVARTAAGSLGGAFASGAQAPGTPRKAKNGLATLRSGGGMGAAPCAERPLARARGARQPGDRRCA